MKVERVDNKYVIKINDNYYYYGKGCAGSDLRKAKIYSSFNQIKAAYSERFKSERLLDIDATDKDPKRTCHYLEFNPKVNIMEVSICEIREVELPLE